MTKLIRSGHPPTRPESIATRFIRYAVAVALAMLAILPFSAMKAATPAAAETALNGGQFHGVVWSQWSYLNDNFCSCDLLLDGLSTTDTYDSVKPKTAAIVAQFQSLGANTIRIPINYNTATDAWWNTYRGIIDAATAQGVNVIVSYWTETPTAVIPNQAHFNTMWNVVTTAYANNPKVYFDPMNEPMGYSVTDLTNAMAAFLTIPDSKGIPRSRIFIPAYAFPSENVAPICLDSRLAGTYVSMHRYAITDSQAHSYDWWVNEIETNKGTCGSRTVVEEFGAQMDSGLNYNDPNSTDPSVVYLRAITDTIRKDNLGAIWCHGIGGRNTTTDSVGAYDNLNIMRNNPSSPNDLPFWVPNASGIDRLKYAWGEGWDNLPQRQAASLGVLQGGAKLEPHGNAWDGQNVGYMVNVGDGVSFPNLSASSVLDVDYAAASTGTFSLYINGTKSQAVTFPATGDWNTFATKTVYAAIPAGATVTLQHDSGDTIINVDYIQQRGPMTARQGATVGKLQGGAKLESHGNAWGGQNVGYMVNVGDGVSFPNLNASGVLDVDYAAASTGTFSLYINGTKNRAVTFPATGDWNTFTELTIPVTIPPGATVTLQHDSGDTIINVDYIQEPQQAEYGSLLGGAKYEIRGGASDGIDVGYTANVGDGVTFIAAHASSHLAIGYATASAGTFSLYVNGIKQPAVAFASTGDWGNFTTKTVSVSIPAGATVTLKHDTADTLINVAYIDQ
ncbi:carbohydrate-binding protein [Streptomyces sp. NPDC051976]|uniref:carbohydrate-binding protein n=1 Tax=Streptomyces sp. NPDC051976 TaxID=3154947 RepID=UPI003440B9FF